MTPAQRARDLNGGCRFTVRLPTRTGVGTLSQGG